MKFERAKVQRLFGLFMLIVKIFPFMEYFDAFLSD